jgi:hypothetical protein
MKKLLASILLSIFVLPVGAAPLQSLNDWMAGTGSSTPRAVRDQFRLYAFGVVMGADILTAEMGKSLPGWAKGVCVPKSTSSSTAMELLRAEALRYPNLGDGDSATGLRQLASKAFPCSD